MKRVLVLGVNGGLGQTFQNLLKGSCDFEGHDRTTCDVSSPNQIEHVVSSYYPDTVINCAAYTAVDKAETETPTALAVNFEAARTLASLATKNKFKLIHFSTDYVFDGISSQAYTEDSLPNPINMYGKSKLQGDQAILKNSEALVMRTSWLYSEYGKSFPEKILTKAQALANTSEKITVVDDQFASPTYALDLAQATLDLAQRDKSGLFNYSCEGKTTWFEFASETIRIFNKIKDTNYALPTSIKTCDLKLPAPRPLFTLLDCNKARAAGVIIRPWQKALEHYLNNLLELKFD